MATQKTWIANDITKDEPITICQLEGGRIRISSGYRFLDVNDDILESLGHRSSDFESEFNTLPQQAKDLLLGLQSFLYNRHLQIEGMD